MARTFFNASHLSVSDESKRVCEELKAYCKYGYSSAKSALFEKEKHAVVGFYCEVRIEREIGVKLRTYMSAQHKGFSISLFLFIEFLALELELEWGCKIHSQE
ncbi:hypothetical protein VNO77_29380 [Canavalia gladiata]|uniref:Uncharacterized protein n=1 Tax=Canavalia gladiata TaxID=3824 RepID=A0AAN9Q7N6_CANGL